MLRIPKSVLLHYLENMGKFDLRPKNPYCYYITDKIYIELETDASMEANIWFINFIEIKNQYDFSIKEKLCVNEFWNMETFGNVLLIKIKKYRNA